MSTRDSSLRLAVALSLCGALAGCAQGSAGDESSGVGGEGACAAPEVFVEPSKAAPGDGLTLTGVGFQEGCADNPGVADGTPVTTDGSGAMTGLVVLWVQDGTTLELLSVDADSGGDWTAEVVVPTEASPGDAWIRVAPAADVAVTVSP